MRPGRSEHRVFAEDLTGQTVRVDDTEAHHLLNVLRLKCGDSVELFDGTGTIATGTIEATTRRSADVRVVFRRVVPPSPQPEIIVAAAPPKGERLRWMVEKLTEIGVDELVLLETRHSVVLPGETKLEKLRANVIGACKQSGRSRLMRLRGPVTLRALLTDYGGRKPDHRVIMAHPDPAADTVNSDSGHVPRDTFRTVLLLIGPEGGFSQDEVGDAHSAGAEICRWPGHILRIETAAMVFAAHLLNCRQSED